MIPDIKLFISDIDGVWTDGGMYYDNTGNEFKKFNTYDSAGVAYLRLLGIPVAIITGEDNQIIRNRMHKLKVEHAYYGVKQKLAFARKLCAELHIELNQVAFIGDDLNDYELLSQAGLSATPANGHEYLKKTAHWILPVKGGDGAFRCFVEKYLTEKGRMDEAIQLFLTNLQQAPQ